MDGPTIGTGRLPERAARLLSASEAALFVLVRLARLPLRLPPAQARATRVPQTGCAQAARRRRMSADPCSVRIGSVESKINGFQSCDTPIRYDQNPNFIGVF